MGFSLQRAGAFAGTMSGTGSVICFLVPGPSDEPDGFMLAPSGSP
mgnify:CR=1 FL=1